MVMIPVTLASSIRHFGISSTAWAGATGNMRIPFSMHTSGRFPFAVKIQRASVISAFSFTFLGYHCYHRELGHKLPFSSSNLIMAGSWGGYSDCIYSMEV